MSESHLGASPPCRYFYTDRLAAAWMARHFGMQLVAFHYERGRLDLEEDEEILNAAASIDPPCYFIHRDSLHLL